MRSTLSLTDTVSRAQKHLATEVDGNFILMSIEGGTYCGLDEIASDIWRRLARPLTVEALCQAMAANYRGDREQITADVLELLASLRDQRLIDVG
ncbi:PqqD family protein [Bradyrhizobium sp. Y36]|uniref:PqqD family protein n=1 Tax=Bradyrhizobium sp. Y36 TaxID=2035447 RepID=UPI000BE78F54|nr:PqqD family protein [Bradyrhizobium sp. Y36]PDT90710.1 PqqD family protein [Bradyrhizobium sp. Y36]